MNEKRVRVRVAEIQGIMDRGGGKSAPKVREIGLLITALTLYTAAVVAAVVAGTSGTCTTQMQAKSLKQSQDERPMPDCTQGGTQSAEIDERCYNAKETWGRTIPTTTTTTTAPTRTDKNHIGDYFDEERKRGNLIELKWPVVGKEMARKWQAAQRRNQNEFARKHNIKFECALVGPDGSFKRKTKCT